MIPGRDTPTLGALMTSMDGRLKRDEPLSKHGSLRTGGLATWWADAHTSEEVRALMRAAHAEGLSVWCVGLGSNTLYPDEGIDGLVLKLGGDLANWEIVSEQGERATACVGAGVVNAHLVRGLLRGGWVGAEFLSLIPGSVGGAVVMNAGTKEQEIASILERVEIVAPDQQGRWQIQQLTRDQIAPSYRHTALPEGAIVLRGWIQIARGDVGQAQARTSEDKRRRDATQPYKLASVGSTFANPEGDFAGRLIEAAGLKGRAVGGARISEHHANFFINEQDASSDDFLRLMAMARAEVRARFDIELRPEVTFVGFDGWRRLTHFEAQYAADLTSGSRDVSGEDEVSEIPEMFSWIDQKRFASERVGVAYGGSSAEREISLRTGRALADALRSSGMCAEVTEYDLPTDLQDLVERPPSALLLGLHGAGGEDGSLQGFLETIGVPYTGSGILSSALAMDKQRAKQVMAARGVPVPRGVWLERSDLSASRFSQRVLSKEWSTQSGVALKPNDSGSSCGVSLLDVGDDPTPALAALAEFIDQGLGHGALAEERLLGPEYSVGFFEHVCLGAICITPERGFYDFHAKYESHDTHYDRVIEPGLLGRLNQIAYGAWRALGCRGVGRVDVMARDQGAEAELVVLEINTIPGMTATSLVPKLASYHGVAFPQFAGLMVASATTDAAYGQMVTERAKKDERER